MLCEVCLEFRRVFPYWFLRGLEFWEPAHWLATPSKTAHLRARWTSSYNPRQQRRRLLGYQGSRASEARRTYSGNVKKCAVGKYPKSEKHGNTAQFSEVERKLINFNIFITHMCPCPGFRRGAFRVFPQAVHSPQSAGSASRKPTCGKPNAPRGTARRLAQWDNHFPRVLPGSQHRCGAVSLPKGLSPLDLVQFF